MHYMSMWQWIQTLGLWHSLTLLLSYGIFLIIQAIFFSFQQEHMRTLGTRIPVGNIQNDAKKRFPWSKTPMDVLHLRSLRQWFELAYLVLSRAFSSVAVWGRGPIWGQDKSGNAQVQAGGRGPGSLAPSFPSSQDYLSTSLQQMEEQWVSTSAGHQNYLGSFQNPRLPVTPQKLPMPGVKRQVTLWFC